MKVPAAEVRGWSKLAREWWSTTSEVYELTPSEMITAREVCRGVTRLDEIDVALRDAPLTIDNRFGERVTHPLVVEQRLLAQTVAKLIGSLRLPEVDDGSSPSASPKQPRRVQVRGLYATK